jgi:Arc/MetJ family transcription regulator
MRATLSIDDDVLAEAKRFTGVHEMPTLVRMALEALIQREAGKRLMALGGSDPNAEAAPRRRPE